MNWIEKLNEAITYIEDNLMIDINLETVSQIACTSSYNFQRMFSYMTDMTLFEYIRKRRMTLAAIELQNNNKKIIDIALKYGYSSPTSFNRAFQAVHGIAPSKVKNSSCILKSYQPLKFNMTLEGHEPLQYRIIKKDAFKIVGRRHQLPEKLEDCYRVVPQLWYDAQKDGTIAKLAKHINQEPYGLLGVGVYHNHQRPFYIGIVNDTIIDDSFEEYIIPAATWVIFNAQGTYESLQTLDKRIWCEWFPNSSYEYVKGPNIEAYLDPDPVNSRIEVWMMIKSR